MPADNLKSYLAEKYMSGPKADAILAKTASQTTKKKKRKKAAATTAVGQGAAGGGGGVMLVDEDAGWPLDAKNDDGLDEDEMRDAVVEADRGFKKRKTEKGDSTWVTLQEGEGSSSKGAGGRDDEDEPTPLDEQPTVVEEPFVGGLVTAKQLKKVVPQRQTQKEEEFTAEEAARAQETVYRDASGRKVDMKAARAEAARLKREREEKEAQKMEWGKGLVQRDARDKVKEEMEKNKSRKFARGRDDADMNEELKAKELWNDPAAAFLTVRQILSKSLTSLTCFTEREIKRSTETRIHRPPAASESLWD